MSITLRDVCSEDLGFLFDVYASTRSDEMALAPWTDEQKKAFIEMQFRAQDAYYRQQFPDADYKVILQSEERVGRVYVLRRKDAIRILDVTILPKYRNSGIGTSLIRDIINEGAQSGRSVQIYVENFNPSLRLFERLGFSIVEREGFNFLLELPPGQISGGPKGL